MKTKYYFHNDASHSWLAVKRAELERLNIAELVSPYSYQKGKTVYLEEDSDAPLFIMTKADIGENVVTVESKTHYNIHPIRSYKHYESEYIC